MKITSEMKTQVTVTLDEDEARSLATFLGFAELEYDDNTWSFNIEHHGALYQALKDELKRYE